MPDSTETKTIFTTGEAAELCNVSQQTIIRCFDAGRLKGFRVPGSKFRRIPREALLAFMRQNDIPTDPLDTDSVKRVLVVDDDPQIVELFCDVLDRDGRFELATANTGYAAGLLTGEFKPDVILLDYMLPDINGNVVCQTVRAKPEMAETKIIVISGMIDDAEVARVMDAGADEFVQKPFDIETLVGRICELVGV